MALDKVTHDDSLASWLALTQEEPLEPLTPICDPHHHLWDRRVVNPVPPFIVNGFGRRSGMGDYRYADFAADSAGNSVRSSVFIECGWKYDRRDLENGDHMAPVGESRTVGQIARHCSSAGQKLAIVAHVDFRHGAVRVREALAAHRSAAGEHLVGIRQCLAWDASDEIYSAKQRGQEPHASRTPAFREGFAVLSEFGLVFESWLFHTNIEDLRDLALAFPSQPMILDHIGLPVGVATYRRADGLAGPSQEVQEQWRRAISRLASDCPNVCVKLSGLTMPVCGFGWEKQSSPPSSEELATAMEPYYSHCVREFGVDRCMFASNFPVDKACTSYTVLWNSFKRLAPRLPGVTDERAIRKLLHDNAVRVYGLEKHKQALSRI